MQLRDAVEVEVVGEDAGVAAAGQLDQLGIDLVHVLRVLVRKLDRYPRVLLQDCQDLQAPTTAHAAGLVAVVGDALELVDHEARHDQACRTGSPMRRRRSCGRR